MEWLNTAFNNNVSEFFILELVKKQIKEDKYCAVCGRKLKSGQKKYCSQKCFHQCFSKTPSIDKLLAKLNEFNWNKTKTGKYFGVSDKAIHKWIQKFNLSK